MTTTRQMTTVLLLLAGAAGTCAGGGAIKSADELFARGDVEEARLKYEATLKSTPDACKIIEKLGFASFLTRRYDTALRCFKRVAQLVPDEAELMDKYSAYCSYLKGDYLSCAEILKRREVEYLNREQVEYFVKHPPYQIRARAPKTVLPFVKSDPLPVVQIEINRKKALAFLDSGQPQIFVDPDFAKTNNITAISKQVIKGFAGGKQKTVSFASVQSIRIGDITVEDTPAWLVNTRTYSKAFGVTIDAVIGTEFLMQFLPTLDYPHAQLVLRGKTEANAREIKDVKAAARIPFVKDGIHFMYAPCYLNGKGPTMMYFDSGFGDTEGASVLMFCRLAEFGFPTPKGKVRFRGGGGAADLGGRFSIRELRVGTIIRRDQQAIHHVGEDKMFSCPGYEPVGLIGHNFLKDFKWTIDFDNGVFIFE